LIRKPNIFLFDEPLSNLDALLRERVRHELKQLFRTIDATVVYVTHDQIEAMTLADRVVVLNRGAIQQAGTPDELYRRPINRFVASFIGSPSMNIFETTLGNGIVAIGPMEIQTAARRSGPVWAGIRPEAIRIGPGRLANVSWIESMGAQKLIGVEIGSLHLTILSHERPDSQVIGLDISGDDVHVFDKESGHNLIYGGRRDSAVH
jgi:multiple sugar transport system ATP-binding protein